MPLPKPQPRQKYHRRSISCDGFLRKDGLWDIEAHMSDIKSVSVDDHERGYVAAGEAFHDMWLRITIDETMTVQEVHASMDATPFAVCSDIAGDFKKLVGTRIGPGWRARCRELLGGVKGCTHLNELLPVISTTAFQTLWPFRNAEAKERGFEIMLDSCHTWSKDGDVAARVFPELAEKSQIEL